MTNVFLENSKCFRHKRATIRRVLNENLDVSKSPQCRKKLKTLDLPEMTKMVITNVLYSMYRERKHLKLNIL